MGTETNPDGNNKTQEPAGSADHQAATEPQGASIRSATTLPEAANLEHASLPATAFKRLPIDRLQDLQDLAVSVSFSHTSIQVDLTATHEVKGAVSGSVYCRASKSGTLMVVESSQASGGGGPIAYDIAMEIATQLDKSLASDRARVSDPALKVWEYYRKERPDVKVIELAIGDFYLGRRTEGPEFQAVTEDRATWPDKSHPIWSLWSGYRKEPKIITMLQKTDQISISDNRD